MRLQSTVDARNERNQALPDRGVTELKIRTCIPTFETAAPFRSLNQTIARAVRTCAPGGSIRFNDIYVGPMTLSAVRQPL